MLYTFCSCGATLRVLLGGIRKISWTQSHRSINVEQFCSVVKNTSVTVRLRRRDRHSRPFHVSPGPHDFKASDPESFCTRIPNRRETRNASVPAWLCQTIVNEYEFTKEVTTKVSRRISRETRWPLSRLFFTFPEVVTATTKFKNSHHYTTYNSTPIAIHLGRIVLILKNFTTVSVSAYLSDHYWRLKQILVIQQIVHRYWRTTLTKRKKKFDFILLCENLLSKIVTLKNHPTARIWNTCVVFISCD